VNCNFRYIRLVKLAYYMNTHSWAYNDHPLFIHDFDNEALTIKLNALYCG